MVFGLIMLLEALTFFHASFSSGGRSHLEVYYAGPDIRFHLPYLLPGGIDPLPTGVFVAAGWILAAGAILLALGCFHRVAAITVFVSWGFLYAIECTRTYWMSYYWLELLVAFLLVWMPASRRFSVDARRKGSDTESATVPRWTIFVLQSQLVVTYFYAGVAKLNADWLFDLMPVRWFLSQPHVAERLKRGLGEPIAGILSPFLLGNPGAALFSWAGAAFDLAIGFLLLHPRTRRMAVALTWAFHGLNHFLLFRDIEWFPLLGATTVAIFFEPDWPDRLLSWLRHPVFRGPDLRWALPGLLLVPGFGVLLGWKSGGASRPNRQAGAGVVETPVLAPVATACVLGWILVQVLLPVRHLLIAGDPRITFEGLSFSWRLKAELYQPRPAEITVNDPEVLRPAGSDRVQIDWTRWPGARVLHREVQRGKIDWRILPRVCVVSSDDLGDRILFNPLAGGVPFLDESDAIAEATRLWRQLYGHAPTSIHRAVSYAQILDSYIVAASRKGLKLRDRNEAMAMLQREHGRSGNGSMIPFLRRTQPFPNGFTDVAEQPFLWIEDSNVLTGTHPQLPRIAPDRWINGPATRGKMDAQREDHGGSPWVVLDEISPESMKTHAARFTLWDSTLHPERPPGIRWDLFSDAGQSKSLHISVEPFLLRRYAHRVASEWKRETGRTPAVHARTFVALNGRPPQAVVDPTADLASVPLRRFSHNPWIRDLELPRIPANSSR
jgi:hypothetical protein